MIWREGRPAMSTTRPPPQESCSNDGSQRGALGSAKRGDVCMILSLQQVSTFTTRVLNGACWAGREGERHPLPEPVPDFHSSVEFEGSAQYDTTLRLERLDESATIWAMRLTASCEESPPARIGPAITPGM